MSAPPLTLAQAARIMRQAVRDKSYRTTPVGTMVGRYLRWFRNEYGASPATIRDYEAILARMALMLSDREPREVTTEDLRDVIDLWSARAAGTRAKVTSIIRAFWSWAEEQGHVDLSPATRIRRPRGERRVARVASAALPACSRSTPVPASSPSRSTRATAWGCSACSCSGYGAPSSPRCRSATSTPSAA
jgi:integrase